MKACAVLERTEKRFRLLPQTQCSAIQLSATCRPPVCLGMTVVILNEGADIRHQIGPRHARSRPQSAAKRRTEYTGNCTSGPAKVVRVTSPSDL